MEDGWDVSAVHHIAQMICIKVRVDEFIIPFHRIDLPLYFHEITLYFWCFIDWLDWFKRQYWVHEGFVGISEQILHPEANGMDILSRIYIHISTKAYSTWNWPVLVSSPDKTKRSGGKYSNFFKNQKIKLLKHEALHGYP